MTFLEWEELEKRATKFARRYGERERSAVVQTFMACAWEFFLRNRGTPRATFVNIYRRGVYGVQAQFSEKHGRLDCSTGIADLLLPLAGESCKAWLVRMANTELLQWVWRRITPSQQYILWQREVNGVSLKELGEEFGVSESCMCRCEMELQGRLKMVVEQVDSAEMYDGTATEELVERVVSGMEIRQQYSVLSRLMRGLINNRELPGYMRGQAGLLCTVLEDQAASEAKALDDVNVRQSMRDTEMLRVSAADRAAEGVRHLRDRKEPEVAVDEEEPEEPTTLEPVLEVASEETDEPEEPEIVVKPVDPSTVKPKVEEPEKPHPYAWVAEHGRKDWVSTRARLLYILSTGTTWTISELAPELRRMGHDVAEAAVGVALRKLVDDHHAGCDASHRPHRFYSVESCPPPLVREAVGLYTAGRTRLKFTDMFTVIITGGVPATYAGVRNALLDMGWNSKHRGLWEKG